MNGADYLARYPFIGEHSRGEELLVELVHLLAELNGPGTHLPMLRIEYLCTGQDAPSFCIEEVDGAEPWGIGHTLEEAVTSALAQVREDLSLTAHG